MAFSSGDYAWYNDLHSERRCNCPTKYGPYTADNDSYIKIYTAVCQFKNWILSNEYGRNFNNASSADWVRNNTCPKGWGKYHDASESNSRPYVQCAQGYVPFGYSEPVYGYVTRYRDAYYNYYSTRVAKS